MAKRFNDQTNPEQVENPCSCGYPFLIRVQDVAVSRRRKNNGHYTVDRYFDCIFCGPQVCRIDVIEIDTSDPWKPRKD